MAHEKKSDSSRLGLHQLAWVAGLVGLPLSHYWLLAKIEPFYSSIYCFLWWSYIFVADLAVYRLRGQSLIRDRPREFVFLTAASVPLWILFEAVNLRIQNWYYVMAPWTFSGGTLFLLLAFGTVLPGIFETMELVVGGVEKWTTNGKIAGHPITVTRRDVRVQWAIGLVMLVLLLIFPNDCFCLAWGFAFFLTEPICYWRRRNDPTQIGRSLLGQLAAGDYTRLMALLVAGFICGGLWEAWNFTARTKWIYSVPFFDQLKLGEMPVLGFFGFPPFALECYALINFAALMRDGRHWELSAGENRGRRGMRFWAVATGTVLVPALMVICMLAAIHFTVVSFDAPMDYAFRRELSAEGVEALRQRNALQGDRFLRLKERPPEISEALYERMRRIVTLSECKGMGIKNARALESLNITGLDELAREEPLDLTQRLRLLGRRVRLEEVKIWIREAKRIR